jgi:putative transposase
MRRTNSFRLRPTPKQRETLFERLEASAYLFNEANYAKRQCLFKDKKLPTQYELCKYLKTSKNFRTLGTAQSQELIAVVDESWRSYLALNRKGVTKKNGDPIAPPRYWKDRKSNKPIFKSFFCRNDHYSFSENGRTLYLPFGLSIDVAGSLRWKGKQGRLRIIFKDGRFYGRQSVDVTDTPKLHQPHGKTMSIDLGAKNLAAVFVEECRPQLFSGRSLLSDWVWHEKRIAQAKGDLARLPHKKYARRSKRMRQAFNSLGKKLVEEASSMGVSRIVLGDTGDQRNEESKFSAQGNQAARSFWNYGQVKQSILNHAEEAGIDCEVIDESYTSRTCPNCGDARKANRKHRGYYLCKHCGYHNNADIVGAINIWRKVSGRNPNDLRGMMTTSSREKTLPLCFKWRESKWNT